MPGGNDEPAVTSTYCNTIILYNVGGGDRHWCQVGMAGLQ